MNNSEVIISLTFHDAFEGMITYPANILVDKTADPAAEFDASNFFLLKKSTEYPQFIHFAVAAAKKVIQQESCSLQHIRIKELPQCSAQVREKYRYYQNPPANWPLMDGNIHPRSVLAFLTGQLPQHIKRRISEKKCQD